MKSPLPGMSFASEHDAGALSAIVVLFESSKFDHLSFSILEVVELVSRHELKITNLSGLLHIAFELYESEQFVEKDHVLKLLNNLVSRGLGHAVSEKILNIFLFNFISNTSTLFATYLSNFMIKFPCYSSSVFSTISSSNIDLNCNVYFVLSKLDFSQLDNDQLNEFANLILVGHLLSDDKMIKILLICLKKLFEVHFIFDAWKLILEGFNSPSFDLCQYACDCISLCIKYVSSDDVLCLLEKLIYICYQNLSELASISAFSVVLQLLQSSPFVLTSYASSIVKWIDSNFHNCSYNKKILLKQIYSFITQEDFFRGALVHVPMIECQVS